MSSKKVLKTRRPALFNPKFRSKGSSRSSGLVASADNITHSPRAFINTNLNSTSSFRYGDKTGLVSTQELPVDYTRFENHIFFHSAVAIDVTK